MAVPKYGGLSGKPLSLAITSVATTGFLLFGYDQGVMSGIISSPVFIKLLPALGGAGGQDGAVMQALVTAIYEIGCLFGAIFVLAYGDRLGRRKAVIVGASIMIIGVIIQVTAMAGSVPLAQFIVGRVVTGVGNGMNTSSIPTYQAECSHAHKRGLLICIEGATIAFGTLISYWIDFGAMYGPPDLTWRFPIAFQIFFGLYCIVGMLFLPESPRWLISRDMFEEGERVIAAINDREINDPDVQAEKRMIIDNIALAGAAGKTRYRDLLTGGKTQHFRRLLLGSSSQFMQQVGGCNAVIYYLPVLFENSVKMERTLALLLGGVNMVIYSIFATLSWFLVERVGRRKLFLVGSVGQCVAMVITFACLIPGTKEAAKGAAFGLFLFMATFGATWLPLPWLYPAEINPIKTRVKANSVSTCANWMFNFLIVMVTPIMIQGIGWGTYLFFACCNFAFIPIIYFFYPETAGRSLEEIDFIFAKGHLEKMSYVHAAHQLPKLNQEEIERKAVEYGFTMDDEEAKLDKLERLENQKEEDMDEKDRRASQATS
ncbi:general substrate transporter [Xylona heveae TC161]|uniref:General substrate transporter n=1 Tax=Xylona heveae (strain CBS 132557 / TC161) TaxID=1328760 RepID=A0A164ZJ86_XYLHT|nr:general substrate transporter [Xylona heveae TC161]KZF19165.1 general substrate transporter [Xylona heveae TC161]